MLMILEHGGRPTVNINVATSARNGNFVELIRLRRNALGWTRAVRCYRKGSKDLLFEEVAADFPREPDGSVDWEPYD